MGFTATEPVAATVPIPGLIDIDVVLPVTVHCSVADDPVVMVPGVA